MGHDEKLAYLFLVSNRRLDSGVVLHHIIDFVHDGLLETHEITLL